MQNKLRLMASLKVRTEGVDGKALPDDEMQCDFVISNNEKDSYGSIMTEKTLQNYVQDCNSGVPFMRDHANEVNSQLGRVFRGSYDTESKSVIATATILRDTDDTPTDLRLNEYIRRIEKGFYNSVSVGFRDATETCNICSKGIFDYTLDDPCPHIPQRYYDGVECTFDVDNARLREVSLVSTPANASAKFLDTREWDDNLQKVKRGGDVKSTDKLSLLERDGKRYRDSLIEVAIKEGIRAKDGFDVELWRVRFSEMESDQIQELTTDWSAMSESKWGSGGRQTETDRTVSVDSELILPSYLFEV